MWPDDRVQKLVSAEFIPVRVHVKDQAEAFQRLGEEYGAQWTPAVLMLDSSGKEQHRMEGFFPAEEFIPQLEYGLGRIDFSGGRFAEAESRFRHVVEKHSDANVAADALYWAGVSRYKETDDAEALAETAADLEEKYPGSEAARKGSVWA